MAFPRIYNLQILILTCFPVFSADYMRLLPDSDKRAVLTQERLQHITTGRLEESGYFSGCHDFGQFKKTIDEIAKSERKKNKRRKNKTNIPSQVFDRELLIYIVSSGKGQSVYELLELIASAQHGRFHTMFPSDVLTPDFILETFLTAYKNSEQHEMIKNAEVDQKNIFHAINGLFDVEGVFVKNADGNFHIVTLHPRVMHHYQDLVARRVRASRFMVYDPAKKRWTLLIPYSERKTLEFVGEEHHPKPWQFLAIQSYQDLEVKPFIAMGRAKEKLARSNRLPRSFFVTDLLFKDLKPRNTEDLNRLKKTITGWVKNDRLIFTRNFFSLDDYSAIRARINTAIKNERSCAMITTYDHDLKDLFLFEEMHTSTKFAGNFLISAINHTVFNNWFEQGEYFRDLKQNLVNKAAADLVYENLSQLLFDEETNEVLKNYNIKIGVALCIPEQGYPGLSGRELALTFVQISEDQNGKMVYSGPLADIAIIEETSTDDLLAIKISPLL